MRCIRAGEVSDAASAHGQALALPPNGTAWFTHFVRAIVPLRLIRRSACRHTHCRSQAMLAQLTADRSIIFYVSKAFEDFKDMEDNPVELSAEPVYGTKFLKETTADPLIRR